MFWIPAIIGAVASIVGGAASAAGASAQADANSKAAAADRASRERIAKMQLEEQKRQARLSEQQNATNMLSSAVADQANVGIEKGRERNAARARLLEDMSRAFGVS